MTKGSSVLSKAIFGVIVIVNLWPDRTIFEVPWIGPQNGSFSGKWY